MKYFFIDTSTHDLNIAIASNTKIFSISKLNNINEHSKYAVLETEKAFIKANLKPNEIDKILVVNGPGSFTGVRIGVTIAKTYAWALNKPIIPVSSLQCFALGYDKYDYYVSVLDARRGCVFAAIYNNEYNEVLKEQYISIDELYNSIKKLNGNIIVIGDISINEYKQNPINIDILKIVNFYEQKDPIEAHLIKPQYLKLVEAEERLMGVE